MNYKKESKKIKSIFFLIVNLIVSFSGKRNPVSVFYKPASVWRARFGTFSGQCFRSFGTSQALAHAHTERPGAFHPDEAFLG